MNSAASSSGEPRKVASPRIIFSVRGLIIVIAIFAITLGLISATMRALRLANERASSQSGCYSSLNNIALAMLTYSEVHGRFPRPFESDPNGGMMHSWRSTILRWFPVNYPQASLYDFGQRWDGEVNRMLSGEVPGFMRCPSLRSKSSHSSQFVMINDFESTPVDQIPGNAILVIESWDANRDWLDPNDRVGLPEGDQVPATDHPNGTGIILRNIKVLRTKDSRSIKKRGGYYIFEQ